MVIEGGYHLAYLPELIDVDERDMVCETEVPINLVKAVLRHELVEVIGAWVLMPAEGGDAPEVLLLSPAACRHQQPHAEKTKKLPPGESSIVVGLHHVGSLCEEYLLHPRDGEHMEKDLHIGLPIWRPFAGEGWLLL